LVRDAVAEHAERGKRILLRERREGKLKNFKKEYKTRS